MAIKLRDIAAELGLSEATISRVINGRDRVDPQTRKTVLLALRKHNYRPNEVARSLRLRTTKTLVVLVPDISNNFYAAIIKGAQAVSREEGYAIMVCNSDESAVMEQETFGNLEHQQIAGLILAPVGVSPEALRGIVAQGTAVVCIDNIPSFEGEYDSVSIDNVAAAYMLTSEVIKRGYGDIAFITGVLTQSSASERLQGYRQALLDAGLPYDERRVLTGDFKQESGYRAMSKLLENPPQAVIVSNNFMTYGALRAIREKGLRIPDQIAVAAFDMVDETQLITPRVASINQPAEQIGRCAAEILLQRLQNPESEYKNILLDAELANGDTW